jgi:hypothetical protein
MVVKFLLIRIAGKGEMRNAFSWVGIPVTGFWDAFTLYKVAREARLRLFGHKLAEHIVSNVLTDDMIARLSTVTREGAVRAVATMMVLAQDYHPNLLVLLVRLCNTFEIKEHGDYDDWEYFLSILDQVSESERYFLLDLLSISAAFDGQLSRMEKHHLPEAFKDLTEIYMHRIVQLKNMLVSGQLHAAKDLCTLDFRPG